MSRPTPRRVRSGRPSPRAGRRRVRLERPRRRARRRGSRGAPARSWAWGTLSGRRTPPRAPPRAARCPGAPRGPATSASARPPRCGSCGPQAWTRSRRSGRRRAQASDASRPSRRSAAPSPDAPCGPRHPRRAFELTNLLLLSHQASRHRCLVVSNFSRARCQTRSFLGPNGLVRGRARRGRASRPSPEPRRRRGAASVLGEASSGDSGSRASRPVGTARDRRCVDR